MMVALVKKEDALGWVAGRVTEIQLLSSWPGQADQVALWVVWVQGSAEFRKAWRIGQKLKVPICWNGGHHSTIRCGNFRGDLWNGTRFYATADSVCRLRREERRGKD